MEDNIFPSMYENFIYVSRYARWLENEKRREVWSETVSRYLDFMKDHLEKNHNYKISNSLYTELYDFIHQFKTLPSMRAMMTAGPALERSNVAGYNCSYLPIDDMKSFDEAMYILMCG